MEGTVHGDQYIFLITSRSVLRIRNVSDKSCIENQNTHLMFSNFYLYDDDDDDDDNFVFRKKNGV